MRRFHASAAFLVLLLALVACAPVVRGASAQHPLPLGGVMEVTPGQSLYVLVEHSLSDLGFNDGDLAPVVFLTERAGRSSGRADNWVSVRPVRVPAWWEVRLEASRFVVEEQGSGVRTTVQSVLNIQVPASAALGSTELQVSVQGRRNSATLSIPLRVRQR